MSTFKVRRLSQSSTTVFKQKAQQKISIQPDKIIFQINKSLNKIVKVKITNPFNQMVQFEVKQPSEPYFKIKFSKKILAAYQSLEVYVFFNPQSNITNINDQIQIKFHINQGYSVILPIFVRNSNQMKKINKIQKIKQKNKQNLNIIRLHSQHRHIGQNKRKAGIMLTMSKFKNGDISYHENNLIGRIRRFQEEFAKIQNFLRQKAIKSQIYRGEKPITKQEHYDIICFNVTIQMMIKQIIKQKIIKRYKSQKSKNGPSVRTLDNIKLQWNKSRNQPKITYKKGLSKLLRQIRNFVIYHRFKKMNKILSIYKNLREEQNVEQPQTKIINKNLSLSVQKVRQKDSQIWNYEQDRQYHKQIQQKKKHDYYCRKINKIIGNKKQKNLGADFTQFSLNPRIIPMDYEAPQQKKNQIFQIKSRIGFDNWVALEQSVPYHHQLIKYTKIQRIFQWECHPNYEFNSKSLTKNYSNNENFSFKKASQIKDMEESKDLAENELKSLIKENFKQLQVQFSQIRGEKYQSYKTYEKTPTEIESLNQNEFSVGQSEALRPLKLNSQAIKSIKQQDYVNFTSPHSEMLLTLLKKKQSPPSLIYNIRKDDIIDFDDPSELVNKKIQYIQNSQCLSQKMANIQQYFKQIISYSSNREGLQEGNQKRGQNYEMIQNMSNIKEKKMSSGQKKIKSYNEYVKNVDNYINF